jgi:hypothetical protein
MKGGQQRPQQSQASDDVDASRRFGAAQSIGNLLKGALSQESKSDGGCLPLRQAGHRGRNVFPSLALLNRSVGVRLRGRRIGNQRANTPLPLTNEVQGCVTADSQDKRRRVRVAPDPRQFLPDTSQGFLKRIVGVFGVLRDAPNGAQHLVLNGPDDSLALACSGFHESTRGGTWVRGPTRLGENGEQKSSAYREFRPQ